MALIYANKIPTLAEAQAAAAGAVRVRDACIGVDQRGEGLRRAPQRQGDAPGGCARLAMT